MKTIKAEVNGMNITVLPIAKGENIFSEKNATGIDFGMGSSNFALTFDVNDDFADDCPHLVRILNENNVPLSNLKAVIEFQHRG